MRKVALHRRPHTRDHVEIARLAIALEQAGEDADDLGVALRPQSGVIGGEVLPCASQFDIAGQHSRLKVFADIAARVLQQRDDIVGRMADQRILEIDQSLRRARARITQQHDVFRVIIAQHRYPRMLASEQRFERLGPRRFVTRDIDIKTHGRCIPFGQQSRLALVGRHVIR